MTLRLVGLLYQNYSAGDHFVRVLAPPVGATLRSLRLAGLLYQNYSAWDYFVRVLAPPVRAVRAGEGASPLGWELRFWLRKNPSPVAD